MTKLNPFTKDLTMTETEILHRKLMTDLHRAIDATVNLDDGGEQAIEVAATALTDTLAQVLCRLPAAANGEGAGVIVTAMSNRLTRTMALETYARSEMMDLSAAHAYVAAASAAQVAADHG